MKDEFVRIIPSLPLGPIAEFGVHEGNSIHQMVSLGRTVYAFDTFTGMPTEGWDAVMDFGNPPGKWVPGQDVVDMLIKKYSNVIVLKGLFSTTVPTLPPSVQFSFVHIDSDTYESHRFLLDWLHKQGLHPEGLIGFDDYNQGDCPGVKIAVDKTVESGLFEWHTTGLLLKRKELHEPRDLQSTEPPRA